MRPTPFAALAALLAAASAFVLLAAPAAADPRQQGAAESLDLPELGAHLDWLDCGAVFVDGPRPKRALTEAEAAVDRSALVDRALARAGEQGRLVLWYAPRIVEDGLRGRQMYRAPVLDLYARQVLFGDPDVSALVATRFVPLRCVVDEALAERFGLRPLEVVEPLFVVLDPQGRVLARLDRLRTFDALWFCDWLRRAARAHAPLPPEGLAELDVEALVAHGEWEAALSRLEEARAGAPGDDAARRAERDAVQAAALLRRLHRPEQALERLASAAGGDAGAARERGRALLALGRAAEAVAPLALAARQGDDEAGYALGLARLTLGDEVGAMRAFLATSAEHPDTLAGRRARANTTLGRDDLPLGAAFAGFEQVLDLGPATFAAAGDGRDADGGAADPDRLRERAVRFLLSMQRDHGGFTDARYAYWPDSSITANTWVAVTALAARALLEHRDVDPPAVDAALARAEGFMFDPARLERGANEDVYADAYRLEYLARRAELDPAWAEVCRQRAAAIVAEAAARQDRRGFFAHEYPNAFCTGAMLDALLAAREAGAQVPDETLARGCDALLAARTANGAFVYGGSAREGEDGSLKDAAARMPLCEAVLLRAGRGDEGALVSALENYWEHLPRLLAVRRNDFHSDGELAGFFFFHGLFHTSQALDLLPEESRAHHARLLVATLAGLPERDGSFLDSHEFGKSYGTAMALLVLANAR